MNKDEKQPVNSGVQPGSETDETQPENGLQATEEAAPEQENGSGTSGEEPEEDGEFLDPEDDEYLDEEEYDWEEDEPLSFGARLFSASTSLLRWIVLVAVLLALLLGGTFFSMYRNVSLNSLPQYEVSWAGQALDAAGYDWSVPVMGFLHRDFSKKPGSSWQDLELVS